MSVSQQVRMSDPVQRWTWIIKDLDLITSERLPNICLKYILTPKKRFYIILYILQQCHVHAYNFQLLYYYINVVVRWGGSYYNVLGGARVVGRWAMVLKVRGGQTIPCCSLWRGEGLGTQSEQEFSLSNLIQLKGITDWILLTAMSYFVTSMLVVRFPST